MDIKSFVRVTASPFQSSQTLKRKESGHKTGSEPKPKLSDFIQINNTVNADAHFQEFDLILMTHPTSISLLPPECKPVPDNFHPGTYRGPGM